MELIADGLLIAGALTAALYCYVLSRRLAALKRMDKGIGGAIAGLSARVEQTRVSLADTRTSTSDITREISALTARAEIAAGRLELLLATLHEAPRTAGGDAQSPAAVEDEPQPARFAIRKADVGAADAPDTPPRTGLSEMPRPDAEPPAQAPSVKKPQAPVDIVAALRRIANSGARS